MGIREEDVIDPAIFERGLRKHVRFSFRGESTIEDLWYLSMEDLDTIYKGLKAQERTSQEDSLLKKKSAEDKMLALKIDIVTYIVRAKEAEIEEKTALREKIAKRQKLLGIKAAKQEAAYNDMSIEDLDKELAELDISEDK